MWGQEQIKLYVTTQRLLPRVLIQYCLWSVIDAGHVFLQVTYDNLKHKCERITKPQVDTLDTHNKKTICAFKTVLNTKPHRKLQKQCFCVNFVWSTKTFLYDIRKQIKMGCQILNIFNIGQS